MKIAVNTRLLISGKMDGIGWFIFETMKRITKAHPEIEFYFLFDRKPHPAFKFEDNVKFVFSGPPARHPVLIKTWMNSSLPKMLKQIQPDIFIAPDGFLPNKINHKNLCVIHDLNFEHHPDNMPRSYRNLYQRNFKSYAEKADRIATVSNFSKNDIVEKYQVAEDKIDIVYSGINHFFKERDDKVLSKVRERLSDGKPYFLFTGTIHPRKNIHRLIKAYSHFRRNNKTDIKLVIAGNSKWWSEEMKSAMSASEFSDDIIFTGRMSNEELNRVTQAALAMVFVSLFEGFGLPILEAAQAGIPLITSNITSMPEIAGDTALLVDPYNEFDIADAMTKIATDENLAAELASKANKELSVYTWDRTADLLWESINKCLNQS